MAAISGLLTVLFRYPLVNGGNIRATHVAMPFVTIGGLDPHPPRGLAEWTIRALGRYPSDSARERIPSRQGEFGHLAHRRVTPQNGRRGLSPCGSRSGRRIADSSGFPFGCDPPR